MKLSGAEILIRSIIDHGVDTVFGYPGGQVLDIYDAIYKHKDKLHHVTTAHEEGACHAADGYSRASGNVGVVIATSGPGATNLVTGIATAFLDSIPLVAITGNVNTSMMGKDSFQEVDITGITMPITKYNYIVKDVDEIEKVIDEAFLIAKSGRPGPVLIDIPKDIQRAKAEYPSDTQISVKREPLDMSELDEVVDAIEHASRPCLFIGGGVVFSDSSDIVLDFARKIDAPIISSMMGLSAVPTSTDRFLGMAGMHGGYASNKTLRESDLLIAIGSRFSDRATGDKSDYRRQKKIVHIDIDPAEIDKNIESDYYLIGSVRNVLGSIMSRIGNISHDYWREKVEEYKYSPLNVNDMEGDFTPDKIIKAVNKHMDDDDLVATDVGQHQMWVCQYYDFKTPRTLLTSGGLGAMGYGLGAAIGGCMATGKRAVLFTSDGSFHMNMNEMATVATENLPILIVVMNNNALGMVKQWQKLFYGGRLSETEIVRHTDYKALAIAMGLRGYEASNMASLDEALDDIFSERTPALISLNIDSDEMVLPMIPPRSNSEKILLRADEDIANNT